MRKIKLLKKLVAFSLSLMILASYIPPITLYASDTNTSSPDYHITETEDKVFINSAIDSGYRAPSVTYDGSNLMFCANDIDNTVSSPETSYATAAYLPSSYSSVEAGYVTEVKNQGKLETNATVYCIAPSDTYDYNYQYDGSTIFAKSSSRSIKAKYANVFSVGGNSAKNQLLKAVSFAAKDASRSYSIQIYKLSDASSGPESGTPLLDEPLTGHTTFAGYYTVDISVPPVLSQNETFAVVIAFDQATQLEQSISNNYIGGDCASVNASLQYQSYYYDDYMSRKLIFYQPASALQTHSPHFLLLPHPHCMAS